MILELFREIGQMVQGHPEAHAEYEEEVSGLKTNIRSLTDLQTEYRLAKNCRREYEEVTATLKQKKSPTCSINRRRLLKNAKIALVTGIAIATVIGSLSTSKSIAGFISREVVLENQLTGNILGKAGRDVVESGQGIARLSTLIGILSGGSTVTLGVMLLFRRRELEPVSLQKVTPEEIQEFYVWRGLKASQKLEMNDVVRHGNHRDD